MYSVFKIPDSYFKKLAGNTEKTSIRPHRGLHAFLLYPN